jgi:hypothetical protein
LVGFGRIASNFTESTGDTLGGIGSAIAIKYGSWKADSSGKTFTGTLVVQPDRGFNVYVASQAAAFNSLDKNTVQD